MSPRLYTGDELPGARSRSSGCRVCPTTQLGALVEQVGATGASVVAQYAVQPSLLDPDKKSLVDTLGSQLANS